MTIYGWDMSHYDWDRGLTAAEIRAALSTGGIAFATHKIGEGFGYTDPRFDDFWRAARGLRGQALLGAYYVNHPGDQASQADRFLRLLDQQAPGWRDGAFILQVDAERWPSIGEPSPAEIRAFVARLRAKAPHLQPIVYAPRWVYGNSLRGLDAPLWASNYGSNPAAGYRQAYPGDSSSRWTAYSGQVPAILQYGSRTHIGSQGTCDANAFRGTLDQLRALVYPEGDDDMTPQELLAAQVGRSGPTVGIHLEQTRDTVVKLPGMLTAILAAVQGDDSATILARLDAMAAEDERRYGELRELVERARSGELDAAEVVDLIGERLSAGAPGGADTTGIAS